MSRGQTTKRRALAIGQRLRIAQPEITRATQQTLLLLFGAAYLIDRIVDDLDRMELVEGDGRIRQVLGDTLDEGWAHIDADLADRVRIAAMRSEVIGEGNYGSSIVALSGEHDAGLIDVDKQCDVAWPRRAAVSSIASRVTPDASVRARASST